MNTNKRGGKRPGAGRKPGAQNKATLELKQLAGEYTEEAVSTLVEIMRNPEASMGVRLAAVNSILDRSHGKPTVAVEVDTPVSTDPELSQKLTQMYLERMAIARERQRQVLIERGLLDPNENS